MATGRRHRSACCWLRRQRLRHARGRCVPLARRPASLGADGDRRCAGRRPAPAPGRRPKRCAPRPAPAMMPVPADDKAGCRKERASRSPRRHGRVPPAAREYCANIANAAADARFAWQKKTLAGHGAGDRRSASRCSRRRPAEYQKWLARRDEFSRRPTRRCCGIYAQRMQPDAAALQIGGPGRGNGGRDPDQARAAAASLILNEMEPIAGRPPDGNDLAVPARSTPARSKHADVEAEDEMTRSPP